MAQFDKWLEFLKQLVSGTKQDGTTASPPGEVPAQPPLSGTPPQDIPPAPGGVPPVSPSGSASASSSAEQEKLSPKPRSQIPDIPPLTGAPPRDIPPAPSGVPPVPPSGSASTSSSAEQAQQSDAKSPWSNLAPMLAQLLAQQSQGGKPDLGGMFSGLLGGQGDVPKRPQTGTDTLQNILDVIGIADPTPIVDSVNAGISLGRAAMAKTPDEQKEHLVNAGISAIAGWIPYLGDTAKIPKFAKAFSSSAGEAARNTKFSRAAGDAPPKPPSGITPPTGANPILTPNPPNGIVPPDKTPPVPTPPSGGSQIPPSPPAGSSPSGYSGALPFLIGAASGVGAGVMVNTVTKTISALIEWGDELKDSQEHLKVFSGLLAAAYQESQVRGMIREFGSAQRSGGTTADLIKSLDNLKDDLQSYKDAMINIKNTGATIATKITEFGIKIIEQTSPIDEIKDAINKWAASGSDTKPAAFDFMENIRKIGEHTKRPRR